MTAFLIFIIILGACFAASYYYLKITINEILNKLVVLDKIFESRYNELSKAVNKFHKYMPEYKDLIIDVQKSKADAAKVSKPKTTKELAQKIIQENALTINLSYLIEKCDMNNIPDELRECVEIQLDFMNQIKMAAIEYNKLIENYNQIKDMFPFSLYAKWLQIYLDLDVIEI